MDILKKIEDIEKLHKVENFIFEKRRPITEQDDLILNILERVMQDYTYGWYVCEESTIEQLISINKFKLYILNLIK
jgi:hypothetical protein